MGQKQEYSSLSIASSQLRSSIENLWGAHLEERSVGMVDNFKPLRNFRNGFGKIPFTKLGTQDSAPLLPELKELEDSMPNRLFEGLWRIEGVQLIVRN